MPDLLDSVNVLVELILNRMMHSKTQTSNRETLSALQHRVVQLESEASNGNDPGTGSPGSNINSIGREMDRDSLRANCIMTAEKFIDVANSTSPSETVCAPIIDIWGCADSEPEFEDLEDLSGDSADEETHGDVDDNNNGPLGTSFMINGIEPGCNDSTPCELLHDVIRLYQAELLARLDSASLPTQPTRPNVRRTTARDINQRSEFNGSTYLIRAVKERDEIEAEELILKGADVNYTDEESRTPLLHAVMEGDGSMVHLLARYGAKLDGTHNGRTILQEAIERGSASIVLQIRKLGAKLDEPTMDGVAPLVYIIQRNPGVSTEVLKAFCCRGEDDAALPQPEMNGVDEEGLTAVHHAVLCDNEDAIEILLSNGADPNIGCKEGETPLHSAVIRRKEIALKKLLQHCNDANESFRVNVNAEDKHQRTPLVFAVRDKGGYEFAKLLLEAGADVDKCIPKIHDPNSLSPPMKALLKRYKKNLISPSRSNIDSASITSSASSIFTRTSTSSTAATVNTSRFSVLRLRRRDTR